MNDCGFIFICQRFKFFFLFADCSIQLTKRRILFLFCPCNICQASFIFRNLCFCLLNFSLCLLKLTVKICKLRGMITFKRRNALDFGFITGNKLLLCVKLASKLLQFGVKPFAGLLPFLHAGSSIRKFRFGILNKFIDFRQAFFNACNIKIHSQSDNVVSSQSLPPVRTSHHRPCASAFHYDIFSLVLFYTDSSELSTGRIQKIFPA